MTNKTAWESIRGEGEALVDKLKELIHEGNIRRIRIVHEGRTVAEFPVTERSRTASSQEYWLKQANYRFILSKAIARQKESVVILRLAPWEVV